MDKNYTDEKNVQILIASLKGHGIRKIIASPGTTNIAFVKSVQNDSYFEVYSSVDERSAAYMACGLAGETGEVVVLSCTGATASRNYLSGLTEAYYRKLPILAVTSTQETSKIGHHIAQVIDRSSTLNDTVKLSIQVPLIKDNSDWWSCEVNINNAILELKRNGGGPVHINLSTSYSKKFDVIELPKIRIIERIVQSDIFPPLPKGKIGIFIGSHLKMSKEQTEIIDAFCESNNGVVFCDHTSGYRGKYCIINSISGSQRLSKSENIRPDLSIHIGEITGDSSAHSVIGKKVWRVSEDGELRDTFGKLQYIFEMPEKTFFQNYIKDNKSNNQYFKICTSHMEDLRKSIPELPFSNLWIAKRIHKLIPGNSTIHFAILNSLRSWNFFELPESVESNSNVGGFGIDGCLSSLIGASLSNRDRLYFGIIGDLSFFYDMNSIGNRHVGKNLRIMLINNGTGTEFKNFNHSASLFGESADEFTAAGGHFGNKSKTLVKYYSESLGFEYLKASNKLEFEKNYERFLNKEILNQPILFEVFTDSEDESKALEIMTSFHTTVKGKTKDTLKNIVGEKNIQKIKGMIRR